MQMEVLKSLIMRHVAGHEVNYVDSQIRLFLFYLTDVFRSLTGHITPRAIQTGECTCMSLTVCPSDCLQCGPQIILNFCGAATTRNWYSCVTYC